MTNEKEMLTENERARFLAALRTDEKFRTTVRELLLTEELIQMPERLAAFMAYVKKFIDKQEHFNSRVETFIDKQDKFNGRVETFIDKQEKFNAEQRETNSKQELVNESVQATLKVIQADIKTIKDDIGVLKGNVARRLLIDRIEDILDRYGVELVDILSRNDLIALARKANASKDIAYGTRQSFYGADLALLTVDKDGSQGYVVAEASYTADKRESDRAIRNAGFLTRFTGLPAMPLIASARSDYYISSLIESGGIEWIELDAQDFQPD